MLRHYQVTLFDDGSMTVQDNNGSIWSTFREREENQTVPAYLREQAAQATAALYTRITESGLAR